MNWRATSWKLEQVSLVQLPFPPFFFLFISLLLLWEEEFESHTWAMEDKNVPLP